MSAIEKKSQVSMITEQDSKAQKAQHVQERVRAAIASAITELRQGTDELHVYLGVSSGMVSLQDEDVVDNVVMDILVTVINDLSVNDSDDQNVLTGIILGALEGSSLHKYRAILRAEAQLEKLRGYIEDEKMQLRSHLQTTLGRLITNIPSELIESKKVEGLAKHLDHLYLQGDASADKSL
jgi:hypothetical protein